MTPRAKPPAHGIAVRGINVRSANVERDLDKVSLDRLSLTGRGADVLRRFQQALDDPARTRAWSVTGPYGSGKSSFALLLANIVSPDPRRRADAIGQVADNDSALAESLRAALAAGAPDGMLRAVAAARREPVLRTVGRALRSAADAAPPRAGRTARGHLDTADRTQGHAAAESVMLAVRDLTTAGPVLLVLDEFGKNLEYQSTAHADGEGDLYLLQELSELSAGAGGQPLYLLTLQHMAFLDYAGAAGSLQRREWGKIQGRFEDVLFVEDVSESARMIGRTVRQPDPPPRQLVAYGTAAARAWDDAGLSRVIAADADLLRSVYPLHPTVAAVAPLLFSSLAQNDRTLSGFLAGDGPHTLPEHLSRHSDGTSGDPATLPTLKLPALYDYLAHGARTSLLASSGAARWLEIESRIQDSRALPTAELDVLKTVAVLNLVDTGGPLRASSENVAFALIEPADWHRPAKRAASGKLLSRPGVARFLTYRRYADEWRLWQGSDVDLSARIGSARAALADVPPSALLPASMLPPAVVAGRHAQATGMLRFFTTSACDASTPSLTAPDVRTAEDGLLVFHLGTASDVPATAGIKPVLVAVSPDAKLVVDAALEARACADVLAGGELDAAAAAELRERAAQSRALLAAALADAYRPDRPDVSWLHDGQALEGHRSISGLVSAVCDRAYSRSPRIRTEMLGRHQLTSQGAKARRVLFGLCMTRPNEPDLGIDHYGPERAIYDGVLKFMGLHGESGFSAPQAGSPARPSWDATAQALLSATDEPISLDQVYALLMAPPYGVKAGVVPLILLCALLVHGDELAVFDDGTYAETLTAAHMERLVKAPDRFSVRAVAPTKGARGVYLKALGDALGVVGGTTGGFPKPLSVVNALLAHARSMDDYSRRTKTLPPAAAAVRTVLLEARDPGELLFSAIPQAVGHKPVTPRAGTAPHETVAAVVQALDDLDSATARLEHDIVRALNAAFRTKPGAKGLRSGLRAAAAGLDASSLEPRLGGIVAHAQNDLPDDDWLEPLVLMVSGLPPSMWDDDGLRDLPRRAAALATDLDNARALRAAVGDTAGRLVSLTAADGTRRVLVVDERPDEDLRPVLRQALERARKTHGDSAAAALLNLLADEAMPPQPREAAR